MGEAKTMTEVEGVSIDRAAILKDYEIVYESRIASLIGRKEVLSGKAKFGIFGDGKEVAQIALSHFFKKGDWRSGYYRDQTLMFALGISNIQQFFSQLYADTEKKHDPATGGRQMNAHFSSRYLDSKGEWRNQLMTCNTAADLSPTAAQMPKSVGLAYASKLFRESEALKNYPEGQKFSKNGDEVCFAFIGNASTSEGLFWESINAAGVLQIPLVISIWDDDYGISVPSAYQTTKGSISQVLSGFAGDDRLKGFEIYVVKGWDYPALIKAYQEGVEKARKTHTPCIFHIVEMTQPQGHSTSGSHERYKSKERLAYEEEIDCLKKLRQWIIDSEIATDEEMSQLELSIEKKVEQIQQETWQSYREPIEKLYAELKEDLTKLSSEETDTQVGSNLLAELDRSPLILRRHIQSSLKQALLELRHHDLPIKAHLSRRLEDLIKDNHERYNTYLYSESTRSPLFQKSVEPLFSESSQKIDGRQVIQKYFDKILEKDPRVFIVGEDVGKLGGVNLEFEGLNEKYGELRVTDTGIREATILGQGIGAAMRGLKPVVDIQYLDYLLYCLQILSDDLATLHYRTAGGQIAPVVVRTKGHRLEGIWHTGSPIGMILGSVRGIHVCTPRNCVQAAGLYNTIFQGDDPALMIEVLNGYRLKELCPDNLGEYSIPLGVPEVLKEGKDVTIVTYGASVRIAEGALKELDAMGVSVELIDVQTLLPFDKYHKIRNSIEKTNAVVFLDEDVPGGASAFMMQQVLEVQGAYDYLDVKPRTLSSHPHRCAYGSDGDYFSKPNSYDVVQVINEMMHEREPLAFPLFTSSQLPLKEV